MADTDARKIFDAVTAAESSDEVRLSQTHAEIVVVQVEGLGGGDVCTPEATVNGADWYTVEGTKTVDGTDTVSIAADGMARFDVAGFVAFRLTKVGAAGAISAWAKVVRA